MLERIILILRNGLKTSEPKPGDRRPSSVHGGKSSMAHGSLFLTKVRFDFLVICSPFFNPIFCSVFNLLNHYF